MGRILVCLLVLTGCWNCVKAQIKVREEINLEILPDGDTIFSSKHVYKYQGARYSSEDFYVWSENSWNLKNTESSWMNAAGKVTKRISTIYNDVRDGILIESIEEFEYQFDTLEISSSLIRKIYDSDLSVFRALTLTSYSVNGKVTVHENKFRESENGIWNGTKIEYQYDENDCLSESVTYSLREDEWNQGVRTEFERDQQCKVLQELRFQMVNDQEFETYARLFDYSISDIGEDIVTYQRNSPGGIWQIYREKNFIMSSDTLIHTEIFHEQTYKIRNREFFVDGNRLRSTSEIAYENLDDFKLTSMTNYFYENHLEVRATWEQRSSDAENIVVTNGSRDFTYNDSGQLLNAVYKSYTNSNSSRSYYAIYNNYRCDGLLESIRTSTDNEYNSTETITLKKYYQDAACDGRDFETPLIVYPNPAVEYLWVYSESDLSNAIVKIFDSGGKLVTVTGMEGPSYSYINISALQPGFYLLQLSTPAGNKKTRFIKTN